MQTKRPRGLGIINTRIINDCLLVTWERGFFDSRTKGVSQFWQGLHKVKHLFKGGLRSK
jgi:hypothetical protein